MTTPDGEHWMHLLLTGAWVLQQLRDRGYIGGSATILTAKGNAAWPSAEQTAKHIGKDRFAVIFEALECRKDQCEDIARLAAHLGIIGDFDGVRVPECRE